MACSRKDTPSASGWTRQAQSSRARLLRLRLRLPFLIPFLILRLLRLPLLPLEMEDPWKSRETGE